MKNRATQPEQLDDLSLQGEVLHRALDSLAWINRYLGNRRKLAQAVWKIIKDNPTVQHFHIVDLGCGGGDILFEIAQLLQKKGIACSLTGIDGNGSSLKYAQEKNKAHPNINYLQADILHPNFSIPICDILISNHFLYHFSSSELVTFFKKNMPNIRLAFINSGLERNVWASRLFKWVSLILPISNLAKQDGLLAIRRAFTKQELRAILTQTSYEFVLNRTLFFRLFLHVYAH
ncbi:MAG: methyltransferase domain-containing protein [Chitinophagales bacterium]|nr:methyltransferase domain-containing protein [Chitinophagales bacterium]